MTDWLRTDEGRDEFRREFDAPQRDAEPRLELDDTMEMAEAVGVTLGYVSACWTKLADAGVFESGRAEQASIELQRFIEERTQNRVGDFQNKGRGEEKPETGLSEYGRGFEAGLGEYADRQLRLAALGHAVSSTTPGHSSEMVMARANEYLRFLQGE